MCELNKDRANTVSNFCNIGVQILQARSPNCETTVFAKTMFAELFGESVECAGNWKRFGRTPGRLARIMPGRLPQIMPGTALQGSATKNAREAASLGTLGPGRMPGRMLSSARRMLGRRRPAKCSRKWSTDPREDACFGGCSGAPCAALVQRFITEKRGTSPPKRSLRQVVTSP
jgi:hypothetical protein